MKRLYNSLLVVMEQFCILTVVLVYSHDKIAQNHTHMCMHKNAFKSGDG